MRNPDYQEAQGARLYEERRDRDPRGCSAHDGAGRATVWASDLTHGLYRQSMPTTAADSASAPRLLTVVAVALIDADGRVLLAQRPAHKEQGGLWEFPGGKINEGELPEVGADPRAEGRTRHRCALARCLAPLTFASHSLRDVSPADAALHLPQLGGRARSRSKGRSSPGCAKTACATIPCPPPTSRSSRFCRIGFDCVCAVSAACVPRARLRESDIRLIEFLHMPGQPALQIHAYASRYEGASQPKNDAKRFRLLSKSS